MERAQGYFVTATEPVAIDNDQGGEYVPKIVFAGVNKPVIGIPADFAAFAKISVVLFRGESSNFRFFMKMDIPGSFLE